MRLRRTLRGAGAHGERDFSPHFMANRKQKEGERK
jgi:hypothetical protein